MDSKIEIVNALDPKCAELESQGYVKVGESWGAHLLLSDPLDLSRYVQKISKIQSIGIQVQQLDSHSAEVVLALELETNDDYPFTPATRHELPTIETISTLWSENGWVYGALKNGVLIGVGATSLKGDEVSIDFGSVHKEHRGIGVGSAIAALGIITHVQLGSRRFSTGGAAVNEASKATVQSLGFVIDELWRSYKSN